MISAGSTSGPRERNGKATMKPYVVTIKTIRYETVYARNPEDAAKRVKQNASTLREIEIVDIEEVT